MKLPLLICWEKTFFFFYEQRVEEHVCTNFITWCRVEVEEKKLQSRKQKVNVLFMRWCTFWKPEAITTSFCSQNKKGIDVNAIWQTCIVHCVWKMIQKIELKLYFILVKTSQVKASLAIDFNKLRKPCGV